MLSALETYVEQIQYAPNIEMYQSTLFQCSIAEL